MDSAWLLCCGTAYQPWNRKIPKSLEDMTNLYKFYIIPFTKFMIRFLISSPDAVFRPPFVLVRC